jgi:hypothetical protein
VLVIGYIFPRGRWCNIIVLKGHATSEDSKESIYEELEQVFSRILMYRTKILLGDCNVKLGREGVFKPTIGNDSLH